MTSSLSPTNQGSQDDQNPKPLLLKFIRNGFAYKQRLRNGRCYLYEQRVQESGLVVGYEVFRKKIKPPKEFRGTFYPAHIAWPHDEAFGSWAWSFYTLDDAIKFMLGLK